MPKSTRENPRTSKPSEGFFMPRLPDYRLIRSSYNNSPVLAVLANCNLPQSHTYSTYRCRCKGTLSPQGWVYNERTSVSTVFMHHRLASLFRVEFGNQSVVLVQHGTYAEVQLEAADGGLELGGGADVSINEPSKNPH